MAAIPDFKIEEFKKNSGSDLFRYRDLSKNEISDLRNRLTAMVSPRSTHSLYDDFLARAILLSLEYCSGIVDGPDSEPDLSSLNKYSKGDEIVFISLNYFSEAAEMNLSDLRKYISWIWYWPADDLVVVSKCFEWVMFVDCHGAVYFGTFGPTQ